MMDLLRAAWLLLILGVAGVAGAAYYPNMVYGEPQELAPGVSWRQLTNASPAWRIHVIEVDMTNRNVELVPVFKQGGNVTSAPLERTSSMAIRSDAIAAVNAGYFTTDGSRLTNSYTLIDGKHLGGAGTNMTAENNRSVLGFSGNHQAIPKRTKMSNALVPANGTNWQHIVNAIAGRGHFVTASGVVATQDNEGTTESHYNARHPRTVIGYSLQPYRAYLVTVDGRLTSSVGMTYLELARLMADLGVRESISLDGGGSTTAWIKGRGIVNTPSDGSERYVISAWTVINGMTMDTSVDSVTHTGLWISDMTHPQRYYLDHLVANSTMGPATITWRPNLERSGQYKVYAWWTSEAGRATAAPYVINHAGGQDTVTVNQTVNGGQWNLLGIYPFEAGTASTVKVSNQAPGTVSADAVRVVRVSEIIDTPYVVTGTLFQTDFETDVSSKFTIAQHIAGDNNFNFNYDYSGFAQQGGGYPTSIPRSPSSPAGGTRALRLATNLAKGVPNAITATLTGIPGQTDMRITFDAWINYGTSLTTEFMTFGASANPALAAMAGVNYMTDPNGPFNGHFFGIVAEGGAAQDYRYYDGTGAAARGNNAARANFLGSAAIDHSAFTGVFPSGLFQTAGATGKAWVRWEILMLDGKIRLVATRPDNMQVLLCDWFTPNAGTPMSGVLPHLGAWDPYASLASPTSDQFVLYDNLKVESITSKRNAAASWQLYQ